MSADQEAEECETDPAGRRAPGPKMVGMRIGLGLKDDSVASRESGRILLSPHSDVRQCGVKGGGGGGGGECGIH